MRPTDSAPISVYLRGSARPGSDPNRSVVWVRGEHDYASRAVLAKTLARTTRLEDADIVVDLSEVRFMDASTVATLVEAYKRLRARGRSLSLRDPSPLAARLLDVCGLTFLLDEQPAAGRPPVAPALDTWVEVPASGPIAPASPPAPGPAPVRRPERFTEAPRFEPAGSAQQTPP